MKSQVTSLLEEARKKMSGYTALLHYRFCNLSVKANAEALIPVSVTSGGKTMPLEEAAKACNAPDREDQFEIYPLNKDLLFPILDGLRDVHPEFKVELLDMEDSEDEEKYILATMPEVDDDRYKVLKEGVDALSEVCDGQLKAMKTLYSGKIAQALVTAPKEDQDEAKDALDEVYDQHTDLCKQYKDEKEKEIEEAHDLYQSQASERAASEKEKQDAHNEQAGMQMKWTDMDE